MFGKLRRVALTLALLDLLATQFALSAADLLRRLLPFGAQLDPTVPSDNPYLHLMLAVIFPAVFVTLSVYDVRRDTRPVGDARSLTVAVAVGTFIFAGALYFSFRDVPRLMVIYFFFIELTLLALSRLLIGLGLRVLRDRGHPLSRILLVGTGEAAGAVALAVRSRLGSAVEFVGCADDGAASGPQGMPVLGGLADVPRLVADHAVDEVILALPSSRYGQAEALAFSLLASPVRLAWPLMLLIGVAIRLDSPGPAIFRQLRVGENGRPFWMYKFRTMVSDAERHEPEVLLDEHGRPRDFKHRGDTRITRVGRWLRRASLDELPQLFNVLRGEMSLVGPRPELRLIVERYEAWQRQRLAVQPGITGWWQVNGRSNLPMHLNTQYDLYYIRNYSIWLDIKILWMTLGAVLRGEGAF
ncbi:MAG: sugar transferase [Chloroflexi bacterium]|nr:sugar transferase [Chloroflexota bacterium]